MFNTLAQYFELNWIEIAAMFFLCIITFDVTTAERIKTIKLKRLLLVVFIMYAIHLIFDIIKILFIK